MSDLTEKVSVLTTEITAVTAAITALIACGKEVYPFVITLLETVKELISNLSEKSEGIADALKEIYADIENFIEQIQQVLAEEGLVSDTTLNEWLEQINKDIEVIQAAAAD